MNAVAVVVAVVVKAATGSERMLRIGQLQRPQRPILLVGLQWWTPQRLYGQAWRSEAAG